MAITNRKKNVQINEKQSSPEKGRLKRKAEKTLEKDEKSIKSSIKTFFDYQADTKKPHNDDISDANSNPKTDEKVENLNTEKQKSQISQNSDKSGNNDLEVIRIEDESKYDQAMRGLYIPPHRLKEMAPPGPLKPHSVEYQRKSWFALKGSINICINKADAANIKELVVDLFKENLIRGKGVLCRMVLRSQMAAPGYSNVLSALIAVVNTKMPEIGELICKRVISNFQRSYRVNDKISMMSNVAFLAHLVNQFVLHELSALELLSLLLEHPTDDSVEVAISFVKQCGARLTEIIPKGVFAVFEAFRSIVSEGKVSKRVQYNIEGLYGVYRDKFADYPAVVPSLDLVNEEDNIVHELSIKDSHDTEDQLDIFRPMDEKQFEEQENLYEEIKNEILGSSDSEEENSDEDEVENEDENEDTNAEDSEDDKNKVKIEDRTSQDLINLRRSIYLTLMSSLNFEETVHKLLKIKISEGEEHLVASMILDCCANERAYQRDIGLIGERLCKLLPSYVDAFDDLFGRQYTVIHRYETTKLRNMAKFFGHLIVSEALPWDILEYIKLTETETTSSSRIFIKVIFQEFAYWMGVKALKSKIEEEELKEALSGIFPKDSPKETRFAINFFTTIGLGALTAQMREHLEDLQKKIKERRMKETDSDSSDSDSSSSGSDSDSSESSSGDDNTSSGEETSNSGDQESSSESSSE